MKKIKVTLRQEQEAYVAVEVPDDFRNFGSEQTGEVTELALQKLDASGGSEWESTYVETVWSPLYESDKLSGPWADHD